MSGGAAAALAPDRLSGRIAALEGDSETLVDLLDERSPYYQGLGSADAERARAHVFAALARGPLPDRALPFVLEELETGMDPAATAAAASALGSAPGDVPGAEALLRKAMVRLEAADVPYDLAPEGGTALGVTAAVLARIEARRAPPRPCCGASASSRERIESDGNRHVRMQDQTGRRLWLDDFLRGEPVVLGFFYTRCMNPERCSLTVTKLARLQKRLAGMDLGDKVRIAAISYDPDWDLPHRLRNYGLERGFRFDARNLFLRTTGPIEPVRALFELGVGYGPSTVNRHRLELFLIDSEGEVARSFTRALWDEGEVASAVARLAG